MGNLKEEITLGRPTHIGHMVLGLVDDDAIEKIRELDLSDCEIMLTIDGVPISNDTNVINKLLDKYSESMLEDIEAKKRHLDDLILRKAEKLLEEKLEPIQDVLSAINDVKREFLEGTYIPYSQIKEMKND